MNASSLNYEITKRANVDLFVIDEGYRAKNILVKHDSRNCIECAESTLVEYLLECVLDRVLDVARIA